MNQNPVYTFAKWQVKEDQLDSVLKLLTEVAEPSRKEEGNLFYKIHQSKSDANTLILFEGYANETALEEHRNSEHFKTLVLGKIIPMLENREVIIASELIPD